MKDLFENMATLENLLETQKQKLVSQGKDYNTIDAFRLIDDDGKGKVEFQDLYEFIDTQM